MSDYAAALERLRRLAGVERGFTDFRGCYHPLADGDLARLLQALGHDTRDAATLNRAADHIEALEWRRVLPPVVVLAESEAQAAQPVMIAPMLPRIRWHIDCEDGARLSGSVDPSACPLTGEKELGGLWYQRRRFDLPQLPAGYHRLVLEKEEGSELGSTVLIVAPARCHLPAFLEEGTRCWGLAVQLYTLRSARNWGIGDFTDLAGIATAAAGLGADLVGVNPLHALFPEDPERASPYSPSSRRFLNVLYIDPEAIPEFALAEPAQRLVASRNFQRELARLRKLELVDYAAVTTCKLAVLRLLYEWFEENAAPSRRAAFRSFVAGEGTPLADFARHHVRASAAPDAAYIDLHCWMQWVARTQLDAAAAAARAAGMRIGLYLDLAVGPDAGGAEASAADHVLATEASVGAPPDPLAPQGQDWGIPPFHPRQLREQAYAPFVRLLRANMPADGALRIDHVMALMRLWWIPRGHASASGGYIHYPLGELMAIVALESRARRCLVVGEALGTVPGEVLAEMERHGLLSYRVLMFERTPDGAFRAPDAHPRLGLVTPTTHDLPTLAAYWRGDDLALRAALGLYSDASVPAPELEAREAERQALAAALAAQGLLSGQAQDVALDDVVDAAQLYVAGSNAAILMLQAEDWLRETRPVNVPGTHRSYPNWRRKLAMDWPELMASARVRAFAARVNAARGAPASPA
jgi:4-alpha-glucanotransferase